MDASKTGALIRQLRVSKGMTQREIAQKLMVSEQAVSKWERGLGCPDISLLRELAAWLPEVFGDLAQALDAAQRGDTPAHE